MIFLSAFIQLYKLILYLSGFTKELVPMLSLFFWEIFSVEVALYPFKILAFLQDDDVEVDEKVGFLSESQSLS